MIWSIGQGRQSKIGWGMSWPNSCSFLLLITKIDQIILAHMRWCETFTIKSHKLFDCCTLFALQEPSAVMISSSLTFLVIWREENVPLLLYFFLYNCCRWGCNSMSWKGLGLVVYNPGWSHLNTWPMLGVSDYQRLWQKECVIDDPILKIFFTVCS